MFLGSTPFPSLEFSLPLCPFLLFCFTPFSLPLCTYLCRSARVQALKPNRAISTACQCSRACLLTSTFSRTVVTSSPVSPRACCLLMKSPSQPHLLHHCLSLCRASRKTESEWWSSHLRSLSRRQLTLFGSGRHSTKLSQRSTSVAYASSSYNSAMAWST